MRKQKFFVIISHDAKDKEKLLHLIPLGPAANHNDTSIEYWIEDTDEPAILEAIKKDFKNAGEEQLFEKISIAIRDIDENGYVK